MSSKSSAKKQRVRVTNKAVEAQQFSTVRLPRKNEVQVPRTNVEHMFEERSAVAQHSGSAQELTSQGTPFDPILNDPLFRIVENSKHWPPPSLDELQASSGIQVGDGFDAYDRREDDKNARLERTKVVRGELNHPRGKKRQNTLTNFDDSDDESDTPKRRSMRRSVLRHRSVSSTDGTAVLSRAVEFFSDLKDQLSSPSPTPVRDFSFISASLRAQYRTSATANDESCLHTSPVDLPDAVLDPTACMGRVVRAAAANCWLCDEFGAEGRAALLATLMIGSQWNNSTTHVIPAESLDTLEKDTADAMAALLRLPPRFTWRSKESATGAGTLESNGGGLFHSTPLESLLVVLWTARAQALARYVSARFSGPDDVAHVTRRLVLYISDQSHPLLRRAARCMGIQHISVLQTVYSPTERNYPMSLDMLRKKLAEDVAHGLYPLLVSGVFGAHCSGAVDPLAEMAELCHRMGIWMHIDAGHAGLALAAQSAEKAFPKPNAMHTDPSVCAGAHINTHARAYANVNISGGSEASRAVWERHMQSFYRASALVDSIHIGPSSFLPLRDGATPMSSLLFVADTAKVRVALQHMHDEGETAGTAWLTPSATDLSRLRLDSPELRSSHVIRYALGLAQHNAASIGRIVLDHQSAMRYVEQRVRADGRFDCTVLSGDFGFVLFRWLTLADEETEGLMRRWAESISSALKNKTTALPRVSVGLSRIHRRVFICLSLAANQEETSKNGESCVPQCELDNLLDLLRQAALTHGISP